MAFTPHFASLHVGFLEESLIMNSCYMLKCPRAKHLPKVAPGGSV